MVSGSMCVSTEALTFNRLEPYVYHTVHLRNYNKVRAFLVVMTEGSQALYVVKIIFEKSVTIPIIVEVLTLC